MMRDDDDYGDIDGEVSVISIPFIQYQPRQYIHASNRLPPVPQISLQQVMSLQDDDDYDNDYDDDEIYAFIK